MPVLACTNTPRRCNSETHASRPRRRPACLHSRWTRGSQNAPPRSRSRRPSAAAARISRSVHPLRMSVRVRMSFGGAWCIRRWCRSCRGPVTGSGAADADSANRPAGEDPRWRSRLSWEPPPFHARFGLIWPALPTPTRRARLSSRRWRARATAAAARCGRRCGRPTRHRPTPRRRPRRGRRRGPPTRRARRARARRPARGRTTAA